jgi:ribosomal protein S8
MKKNITVIEESDEEDDNDEFYEETDEENENTSDSDSDFDLNKTPKLQKQLNYWQDTYLWKNDISNGMLIDKEHLIPDDDRKKNIKKTLEDYIFSLKIWDFNELNPMIKKYLYLKENFLEISQQCRQQFNNDLAKLQTYYTEKNDIMKYINYFNFVYFMFIITESISSPNSKITTLVLRGLEDQQFIANVFNKKNSLREIKVLHFFKNFDIIGFILYHNKFIQILSFFENNYWNLISMKNLEKLLARNISVELLDFSYNKIDEEEMKILAYSLKNNNSIKEIKLVSKPGYPNFKGLIHFYEMLKSNTSIKNINLSGSILTTELKNLAEALEVNKTLKSINLSFNQLDFEFIVKLNKILESNNNIENIDLSSTGLKNKELKELSKSLRLNNTIKEINLENNLINYYGFDALKTALNNNKSITSVNCNNNDMENSKIADILRKAFKKNMSVINIGFNDVLTDHFISRNKELIKELINQ